MAFKGVGGYGWAFVFWESVRAAVLKKQNNIGNRLKQNKTNLQKMQLICCRVRREKLN